MASTSGYSLDLGLPQFPDPTAVPANMYDAVLAIHQSLAALAKSYDILLGTQERSYEEYEGLWNVDYRDFNTQDRLSVLYLVAAEDIDYGQIVTVAVDGKVRKNTYYRTLVLRLPSPT